MKMDLDDGDDIVVDMAPLIDCVFLLLIFFLVATVMKAPEHKIPIDLPEAALSGIETPANKDIKIGIDKAGLFYIDGESKTSDEVATFLVDLKNETTPQEILIDIDRETPARYMVQMMDLCKFHGAKISGIHTQGRSGDKARFQDPKKKKQ